MHAVVQPCCMHVLTDVPHRLNHFTNGVWAIGVCNLDDQIRAVLLYMQPTQTKSTADGDLKSSPVSFHSRRVSRGRRGRRVGWGGVDKEFKFHNLLSEAWRKMSLVALITYVRLLAYHFAFHLTC